MTTIHEDKEMEFVNWDAAGAGTGYDVTTTSEGAAGPVEAVAASSDQPNMDLVFGDIEGDDWSYWAIEHFESTQIPQDVDLSALPEPEPAANSQMYWETPEAPCTHCAVGGYQCKRIREGKYRGYCTSCVALRCECSFGPLEGNLTAEAGATFPANPWPIMGDRPETSILHEDELAAMITSAPPAPGLLSVAEDNHPSQSSLIAPKIGARFSRESVKVLKNWVVTHSRHPYPTEEEKEGLQKITGLNKTQITNWLANARRRGKIQPTRAVSPHVGRGYAQAIDIPQRRGTPASFEYMNPLQRWANSPPENEPASVAAIARAVSASSSHSQTSGSGRNSPYVSNCSDDGSSRSLCNQSSASSLGTSHSSGGSFASAFSNKSHNSFGSLPSFVRTRGRRRRRRAPPRRAEESINQPPKTFQCTFCTETFRTKHDWQRHEKSLHLSLERWICSPDGPTSISPDNGLMSCVFCGEANPNEAHVESHNFSGCTERTLEERTFYRKDHLRQHLKLVHNVKFLPWTMDKWRVASPEIRSRCGFCGVVLDSWTVRVDHVAEHFKTGNTMADWKGDWGFEAPVLEMVENSIPPYLIHHERNTVRPFRATSNARALPTPSSAYELLKMELKQWMTNFTAERGRPPTDDEIQLEACHVIYEAEGHSNTRWEASSWLRDLVLSSEEHSRNAASHNRSSALGINGAKDNIFKNCELEKQMQDFVKAKQLLGLTAMDHELQVEACRIIGRMEEKSGNPMEDVANWLLRMIYTASNWLENFRQRASLPRSEDVGDAYLRSKDPNTIDSTIHNYSRLNYELGEYLQGQRAKGIEPDDADLQRKARIIIYDTDDEWNQTAADDREWLLRFRERYPPNGTTAPSTSKSSPTSHKPGYSPARNRTEARDSQYPTTGDHRSSSSNNNNNSIKTGPFFLNDTNCYRRLAQGLSRFVASTMSPNNPNRHVPTDEELQYQARWLIYDDDDPWNQTAADNFEWLQRFKRDVGILPTDSGPGLGSAEVSWAPSEEGGGGSGSTGFAPPYTSSSSNPTATMMMMMEPLDADPTTIFLNGDDDDDDDDDASKPKPKPKFSVPVAASSFSFLQTTCARRYPAPATVFCSRELETGLTEYVRREVRRTGGGVAAAFPTDDALRERARQIMAMQKTSCDDPVLLERFKVAVKSAIGMMADPLDASSSLEFGSTSDSMGMGLGMGVGVGASLMPGNMTGDIPGGGITTSSDPMLATLPAEMDMDVDMDFHFTEQEMNDMLQEISPSFGSGATSLNHSPVNHDTNDAAAAASGFNNI
ncbi:hypothetical protein M426DRAFT_55141 [Hypoxylon sp. CI-4A]|nr:hypothetical protein M426DRAFT_55141 [Hypoxylon sp. CI-4A]